MEHTLSEQNQAEDPRNPPGIVIVRGWEDPRRPAITAFIWGGKVAPVPAIPYGRASAA